VLSRRTRCCCCCCCCCLYNLVHITFKLIEVSNAEYWIVF
jgi:hypothetical protein